MAKVIEFPGAADRLAAREAPLRKLVIDHGGDEAAADWILSEWRRRCAAFDRPQSFQGPPEADFVVEEIIEFHRDV